MKEEDSLRQFQIIEELFRSNNGAVYKARRRFMGRGEVVCLKERRFAELGRKRDIMNEVQLLQRTNHPNIVRCHSHFWEHSTGALVMVLEYVDGGDLYSEILRRRTLRQHFDEATIWSLFYQICLAVHHLHERGIIHRDIKTLNIIVSKDLGVAKVADLGVSRQVSEETLFLKTFYGTPLYASPELCRNRPYNEKTDIWSLGVVLYEMAALTQPFHSDSLVGLGQRITEGRFPPLPEQYSPMLSEVVKALLQVESENRPSIATVLSYFRAGKGLGPPAPNVPASPPPREESADDAATVDGPDEAYESQGNNIAEEASAKAGPKWDLDVSAAPDEPPPQRPLVGQEARRSSSYVSAAVEEKHKELDCHEFKAEPATPSKTVTALSKSQRRRGEAELKRKRLHLKNIRSQRAVCGEGEAASDLHVQESRLAAQVSMLEELLEETCRTDGPMPRPSTAAAPNRGRQAHRRVYSERTSQARDGQDPSNRSALPSNPLLGMSERETSLPQKCRRATDRLWKHQPEPLQQCQGSKGVWNGDKAKAREPLLHVDKPTGPKHVEVIATRAKREGRVAHRGYNPVRDDVLESNHAEPAMRHQTRGVLQPTADIPVLNEATNPPQLRGESNAREHQYTDPNLGKAQHHPQAGQWPPRHRSPSPERMRSVHKAVEEANLAVAAAQKAFDDRRDSQRPSPRGRRSSPQRYTEKPLRCQWADQASRAKNLHGHEPNGRRSHLLGSRPASSASRRSGGRPSTASSEDRPAPTGPTSSSMSSGASWEAKETEKIDPRRARASTAFDTPSHQGKHRPRPATAPFPAVIQSLDPTPSRQQYNPITGEVWGWS